MAAYSLIMDEEILNSILSSTNRPLQEAKEQEKMLCVECYNSSGELKFFLKEAGLGQHFKIKHRSIDFTERITNDCKAVFQMLHGQETYGILKQLSKERLQMVRVINRNYTDKLNKFKNIFLQKL